jgi:hypothetical protein
LEEFTVRDLYASRISVIGSITLTANLERWLDRIVAANCFSTATERATISKQPVLPCQGEAAKKRLNKTASAGTTK